MSRPEAYPDQGLGAGAHFGVQAIGFFQRVQSLVPTSPIAGQRGGEARDLRAQPASTSCTVRARTNARQATTNFSSNRITPPPPRLACMSHNVRRETV